MKIKIITLDWHLRVFYVINDVFVRTKDGIVPVNWLELRYLFYLKKLEVIPKKWICENNELFLQI